MGADRSSLLAEEMVEVECRCSPHSGAPGCEICRQFDELRCARGQHCTGLTTIGSINGVRQFGPATVGMWLDEDANGYPRGRSGITFSFPSAPDLFFCEDCEDDLEFVIDRDREFDTVVSGIVEDSVWEVRIEEGRFRGVVHSLGSPSWSGETWSFDQVGPAIAAAKEEAESRYR